MSCWSFNASWEKKKTSVKLTTDIILKSLTSRGIKDKSYLLLLENLLRFQGFGSFPQALGGLESCGRVVALLRVCRCSCHLIQMKTFKYEKKKKADPKKRKTKTIIWKACKSYSERLGSSRVHAVRLGAGDAGGSRWRSMLGSRLVQHVGGRIVLPDPLQVKEKAECEEGRSKKKKRKGAVVEPTMCTLLC